MVGDTQLAGNVHLEFRRVKVFNPTPLGNTNGRIRKEGNVPRRIGLERGDEHLVDFGGLYTDLRQGVFRPLGFLPNHL
jgi:hypothetical protein